MVQRSGTSAVSLPNASRAIRPEDADLVDTVDFAQADVGAGVVAGEVATAGLDEADPAPSACPDADPNPEPRRIGPCPG